MAAILVSIRNQRSILSECSGKWQLVITVSLLVKGTNAGLTTSNTGLSTSNMYE